jgi:RHS repeat-associated protein
MNIKLQSRTEFKYDEAERITDITNGELVFSRRFFEDGDELTMPGGAVVSRRFSPDRTMVIKQDSVFPDRTGITIDDHLMHETVEATELTTVTSYDYNSHDELICAASRREADGQEIQSFRFEYDNAGNRTRSVLNGRETRFINNELNQTVEARLADGRSINLSYDGSGHCVAITGGELDSTFKYNEQGRLAEVASGFHIVKFEYDEQGRRVSKQVTSTAKGLPRIVEHLSFVYDNWNLIYELDELRSKEVLNEYIWDAPEGAGLPGTLLAMRSRRPGGSGYDVWFYHYDLNGNVVGLSDMRGKIVAEYAYSPFGQLLRKAGPAAARNMFRFSTKYLDNEANLYYYGLRYYNPETAEWTKQDPIGRADGANLYRFCWNDPINNIDVLGLKTISAPANVTIDANGRRHSTLDGKFVDENGTHSGNMNSQATGIDVLSPEQYASAEENMPEQWRKDKSEQTTDSLPSDSWVADASGNTGKKPLKQAGFIAKLKKDNAEIKKAKVIDADDTATIKLFTHKLQFAESGLNVAKKRLADAQRMPARGSEEEKARREKIAIAMKDIAQASEKVKFINQTIQAARDRIEQRKKNGTNTPAPDVKRDKTKLKSKSNPGFKVDKSKLSN